MDFHAVTSRLSRSRGNQPVVCDKLSASFALQARIGAEQKRTRKEVVSFINSIVR